MLTQTAGPAPAEARPKTARPPPPSPAEFAAPARRNVTPTNETPAVMIDTQPKAQAFHAGLIDTALFQRQSAAKASDILEAKPAAAPVDSSDVHEVHAVPAPLWRTVLAAVVDLLILSAVLLLFLFLAGKVAGLKGPPPNVVGIDAIEARLAAWQSLLIPAGALSAVLALAYGTAFGILGRTPGRLISGLRLVDGHGLPPAPARATVRAVFSLVSFALFMSGFWLALFDRRRQTLHDKLTATFVVRML